MHPATPSVARGQGHFAGSTLLPFWNSNTITLRLGALASFLGDLFVELSNSLFFFAEKIKTGLNSLHPWKSPLPFESAPWARKSFLPSLSSGGESFCMYALNKVASGVPAGRPVRDCIVCRW